MAGGLCGRAGQVRVSELLTVGLCIGLTARVYCENCCPEHGGKVQVAGQTAEDISATGA